MALVLLATGEALAETAARSGQGEPGKEESTYNPLGGVALMMLFATLSGFAGVFMEKMFKKKAQMSFYMKSLLLYFWGTVVNGIGMYLKDG
jgi:hypothetical protein